MNREEGEAISAAFEKMAYKLISKAYYSPTGLSTPNKIYADVHAKHKAITLDLVRQWFSENVQKTKQVGGVKNSYVAQTGFQNFPVQGSM